MHYIVGIDFGTHYTKVAYRASDSDKTHLFKFDNFTYKLPSTIKINSCNDWVIGFDELNNKLSPDDKLYRYFKIAYAQSDEVDLYKNVTELTGNSFKQYSADLLSIAYLHRLIVYIKAKVGYSNEVNKPNRGILSRLRSTIKKKSINTFEWRIGVPTEYSSKNQEKRFVKFNLLLLIAKKMSDEFYTTSNDFNSLMFNEYSDTLKQYVESNQQLFKSNLSNDIHSFFLAKTNKDISIPCMQKEGLRVIPETAAAINIMVSTNSILPGIYSSIDIGGGSTDITFFHVSKHRESTPNKVITDFSFLGSVSVNLGVNDLVKALSNCENSSVKDIRRQLFCKYDEQNESYKNVLNAFYEALEGHLIYLYQRKIMFSNGRDKEKVKGAFALMLGGGALLPTDTRIRRQRQFLVFNSGNDINYENHINLDIKPLHTVGFNQNTIPTFESLGKEANTVMIAFGLTSDLKRVNKFWNFGVYNDSNLHLVRKEEVGKYPWQIQINYVYERLISKSNSNSKNEAKTRNKRNKIIDSISYKNGKCLRIPAEGEDYPDIQKYFQCLLQNKYKVNNHSRNANKNSESFETAHIYKETNTSIETINKHENKESKKKLTTKSDNYECENIEEYTSQSIDIRHFSCIIDGIDEINKTILYHSINETVRKSNLNLSDEKLRFVKRNYQEGSYISLTFDETVEKNVVDITIPGKRYLKRKRRGRKK